MWKFTDLEGCRCLIVGEVNTGKTQMTQTLLNEALALQKEVAVIDMGPGTQTVGGKLICDCDYYTTDIETPRLSGKTEKEVITLATINKKRIDTLLETYTPCKVLFINDVSIYLQRGEVETIVSVMSSSETCIINGYIGKSLGNDPFSVEERRKMIELQKHCNIIIWR